MEWEKEAQEVVEGIPMPEIMKNMTIRLSNTGGIYRFPCSQVWIKIPIPSLS